MEYELEELLPIVAALSEKFTSKESSSITYEAATTLMDAVLYCIEETNKEPSLLSMEVKPPLSLLYQKGYELVIEKAKLANQLYTMILTDFDDYGCENYRGTILAGMPVFFTRYDPKSNPQNHILTLDYPLLLQPKNCCGIDLIYDYLKGTLLEQQFLHQCSRQSVVTLLENILPDYRTLYFDNIVSAVLLQAIGCSIADKPWRELTLTLEDLETIATAFIDADITLLEQKICATIAMILSQAQETSLAYFQSATKDLASRIYSALQYGFLPTLFLCEEASLI